MNIKQTLGADSNKTAVIAVVALVAVIATGLFFMSSHSEGDSSDITDVAVAEPASGEDDLTAPEIVPGNPVVAKVGDNQVLRSEVLSVIQQLPPQTRQKPLPELFAFAQNRVINGRVIEAKASTINLENDEEYQEQLERAKKEITRNIYVNREVSKLATEERMKEVYQGYLDAAPEQEERKARHILVADEAKANEILEKIKAGEDFAKMAQENSTDATAQTGGDLGYFVKQDVVPAFAEAVFSTEPGKLVPNVVQSRFGFHVIEVEDARPRPAPSYEDLKPQLESQVRREALDKLVDQWKEEQAVELFDINGNAIEPAAGE